MKHCSFFEKKKKPSWIMTKLPCSSAVLSVTYYMWGASYSISVEKAALQAWNAIRWHDFLHDWVCNPASEQDVSAGNNGISYIRRRNVLGGDSAEHWSLSSSCRIRKYKTGDKQRPANPDHISAATEFTTAGRIYERESCTTKSESLTIYP